MHGWLQHQTLTLNYTRVYMQRDHAIKFLLHHQEFDIRELLKHRQSFSFKKILGRIDRCPLSLPHCQQPRRRRGPASRTESEKTTSSVARSDEDPGVSFRKMVFSVLLFLEKVSAVLGLTNAGITNPLWAGNSTIPGPSSFAPTGPWAGGRRSWMRAGNTH